MTLYKALQPVGFTAGWHYAHMETYTVYHFGTGEASKDFGSSKKKLLTISIFVKTSSFFPRGRFGALGTLPRQCTRQCQRLTTSLSHVQKAKNSHVLPKHNRSCWSQKTLWTHLYAREKLISTQLNLFCSSIIFLIYNCISQNPSHNEVRTATASIKTAT